MAQRSVEIVIGRLITDEEFRETFLTDPLSALNDLLERGIQLTRAEMTALTSTDSSLWTRVADQIDDRLQKASLTASRPHPRRGPSHAW